MHPDLVTEAEIHAYLDGELDLRRRIAVEGYLAQNAEAAVRFMADLQLRSTLRLIATEMNEVPAAMGEAATRLGERLASRTKARLSLIFGGPITKALAAAALLAIVLVPARIGFASPPAFVGDAVKAYQTGLLRARMDSQVETPHFDAKDANEVQRKTQIRMPKLPAHWIVTDAQIFPSEAGPALQLMVSTPSDQIMSIFAIRANTTAPEEPRAVREDGKSVVYWREGDMSYALTSEGRPELLDAAADNIAAEQN